MTSVAVVAGTRWRKVLPLPTRQMAYKSCSVYTHTRSLTCMGVFMRFKLFANFLLYLLFEFLAFWPFLHSSPVVAQLCHSILQVVAKNCALFSFSLQLWGFCAYAFLAYSFCDIFIIVFVVFFCALSACTSINLEKVRRRQSSKVMVIKNITTKSCMQLSFRVCVCGLAAYKSHICCQLRCHI